MRISCAEVIEIFGDSDSENVDDFAGFSPDDVDVLGHNDEWRMSERQCECCLRYAYDATNDDFAGDWSPTWAKSEMGHHRWQRLGLRLIYKLGCTDKWAHKII